MGTPFVGTLLFLMAKVAQCLRSPASVSSSTFSTTILWAQPHVGCAVARGPPCVTRRHLRRAHDQPAVASHPSEAHRAAFVRATRCADALAGQPRRLIRGEEHDDRRDVLWLSKQAPERSSCRYHLLGVLAANQPDAVGPLGLGVTRRHGID